MIELKHVYKTYQGDRHSLRDLSFAIQKNEFVFLIGPSGAGKTTLFKVISAFEKITSGQIQVFGKSLSEIKLKDIPYLRRQIGFVFQNYKLLRNRTVRENIELPLLILNEPARSRNFKIDEMLEKVDLTSLQDQYPDYLSGGEQQRVAIARALIHQPKLIIADEPTGNLDPQLSEIIMDLFNDFSKSGATFLVATHDHRLIKKQNCRVLEIEKGCIVKDQLL